VSCASAAFCVAVGEIGNATVYNGSSWTGSAEIDPGGVLESVSCPTSSFCMAVGGHNAVRYQEGMWGSPTVVDTEAWLRSVSCTSPGRCVAVAEQQPDGVPISRAYTLNYESGTWGAASEVGLGPERGMASPAAVACACAVFCQLISNEGEFALLTTGGWSGLRSMTGAPELNVGMASLSCPSSAFCAAVAWSGYAFTYAGTATPETTNAPGSPHISGAGNPRTRVTAARRPSFNARTGRITVEYIFPGPGRADATALVTATRTAHNAHASSCRGRGRRRCAGSLPFRYGQTVLHIASAGARRLRISASRRALTALRQGATLTVRIELTFMPADGRAVERLNSTVAVRLVRPHAKDR
jgi:hypothetical protein